jgi:hypothetical protein
MIVLLVMIFSGFACISKSGLRCDFWLTMPSTYEPRGIFLIPLTNESLMSTSYSAFISSHPIQAIIAALSVQRKGAEYTRGSLC